MSGLSLENHFPTFGSDPKDKQWSWAWDRMHFPNAMTPLTASIEGPAFEEGFSKAAEFFAKSYSAVQVRFYNYYWYQRVVPYEGDHRTRRLRRAEVLSEWQPRAKEIFETQLLPEIWEINRSFRDFDYAGAPTSELLAFFQRALRLRARIWEIHFLALHPVTTAANELLDLCEAILGPSGQQAALDMLQGFPNKTLERDSQLWNLAKHLRSNPKLSDKLSRISPERWQQECQRSSAGRAFLERAKDFLHQYGWTVETWDFHEKPWIEAPALVFRKLRLLTNSRVSDPIQSQREAATRREQRVITVVATLTEPAKEHAFRRVLNAAQQWLPLMEDHSFYIDQMNTSLMRLPILALGERLVDAKVLSDREDVFFLTAHEVLNIDQSRQEPCVRSTIETRRSNWEQWKGITPPEHLGRADPTPTSDLHTTRFFGSHLQPANDARILQGRPTSRGVATGRVHVMHDIAELSKFQSGEILVCNTTSAAWTSSFAQAAAVVTDTGGELSHSAVVAREYGIPCVAGTRKATSLLSTGQIVTVDGTAGIVSWER